MACRYRQGGRIVICCYASGRFSTWLFILAQLSSISYCIAQQPISQVRLLPPGAVVTTTGTITSDEFGDVRYMQDANAGITIYADELTGLTIGDSIVVTGVLSRYRGDLQLSSVMSYQTVGTGKSITPVELENLMTASTPEFESRKIILSCAGIKSCESELDEGWYELYDVFGNIARLWIVRDHAGHGFPVSDRPVTIEGVWTKFEDQYQLMCQDIYDASEGSCHYIPPPQLSFAGQETVLTWNDVPEALTSVWIGEEEYTIDIDLGDWSGLVSVTPDFLEPGSIYKTRLTQEDSKGILYHSIPVLFSLPSEPKPIEIIFNRPIDESYSDGSAPLAIGSSAIENDLIQRIDNVSSTLDIAMYNTGRSSIVQAVTRAVQRGVNVRYIADDETSNNALDGQLSFPVLFRSSSGIMHNKFVIGDAALPQAWLWTGSTNLTSNQLSVDPNHAYIIHDQAMALNYRREFEEMWGSLPDRSDARYGDFKTNNTAHLFKVGETVLESYFSPSDETNCRLIESLRSADHQALIGLLLLTKEDVVDEIIQLHQKGIDVRVIIEDEESSASALSRLRQANVRVVTHDISTIFHHKYAIIDEGHTSSDPQVVTGSHNWTWSADNINDENTLIIHDQSVTNIFRQEFEARWSELVPTSVDQVSTSGLKVYPNPASDVIYLLNQTSFTSQVELINVYGQVIQRVVLDTDETNELSLHEPMVPGIYQLRFQWPDHTITNQLIIIH